MKMSKLGRLAAAVLTTAVVGSAALVSTGGSASAQDNVVYFSRTKVTYGQSLTIHGTTTASSGNAKLYSKPYKGTWKLIRTDSSPSSFSWSVKPVKYTQFKVYVTGVGTTNPRGIKVARKLTRPAVHSRSKTISGKVSPRYKKRPVVIQKKKCNSCGWKVYKKVRTNKYSKWSVRIPVKKMKYRAVVGASNGLVKSYSPVQQVIVTYGRPSLR
ncbi:hypothetical protein [Nocardioides sp. KR10-350]|uniref:hypothetical protein n=1 Tax=Nocardioides cheoyonin TaxID=3156615 RepID=UPI0032B51277